MALDSAPLHSRHNTFLLSTETMCTGKISTASTEWVTLAHLMGWLLVTLEGASRQLHLKVTEETTFEKLNNS